MNIQDFLTYGNYESTVVPTRRQPLTSRVWRYAQSLLTRQQEEPEEVPFGTIQGDGEYTETAPSTTTFINPMRTPRDPLIIKDFSVVYEGGKEFCSSAEKHYVNPAFGMKPSTTPTTASESFESSSIDSDDNPVAFERRAYSPTASVSSLPHDDIVVVERREAPVLVEDQAPRVWEILSSAALAALIVMVFSPKARLAASVLTIGFLAHKILTGKVEN